MKASDTQNQPPGIFQQLLDTVQEANGLPAVDDTMVVRQSDKHDRSDDHLSIFYYGPFDNIVHA